MTESTYRIAARSAVATADVRLLRAARTDAASVEPDGRSLVARLRARIVRKDRAAR